MDGGKAMSKANNESTLYLLLGLYVTCFGHQQLPPIAQQFVAENRTEFKAFLTKYPDLFEAWVLAFGEL